MIVSFLSGVNLMMSGIMGLYIGRIHAEVKGRPLYVVGERVGFAEQRLQDEPRYAPARRKI